MAIESPALAEALVAYSANQLSEFDDSYSSTALLARSRSLSALAKSITNPSYDIASREAHVAAALVLLTSEVCHGNYAAWYQHLVGAKHLILSAGHKSAIGCGSPLGTDAFQKSQEGRWVLRNFAYHDILGSVTMGTSPLIDASYLRDMKGIIDTYMGVGIEILTYIAQISTLVSKPTNATNINTFRSIEEKLLVWQPDSNISPGLNLVASAYRNAALIYLYREMRCCCRHQSISNESQVLGNADEVDVKIGRVTAEIISVVSQIPLGDMPESALLFPLFMAGGESHEDDQIEVVRSRLIAMMEKRRFHNIQRALDTLEKVWSFRQSVIKQHFNVDIDWKDVIEEDSLGGLLLT
nr:C6 transcription factor [Colletotrichum truncatum]KAF6797990.1 C6 transcription factor [Colletotrichum truncatum]